MNFETHVTTRRDTTKATQPYYFADEIAVRWCDLLDKQDTITRRVLDQWPNAFPDRPDLYQCCRAIHAAMESGALPYGWSGHPWSGGGGDYDVDPGARTVKHADLKAWVAENFPDQKPGFLFGETERSAHSAVDPDALRDVQLDQDAKRAERDQLAADMNTYRASRMQKIEDRNRERELRTQLASVERLAPRAETTYLHIIACMVELMLGKTPAGKRVSVYRDQEAVIQALLAHFPNVPGLSRRTLHDKFAKAKRRLESR